eukprot:3947214-Amphidinium_carterae.1
MSRSRTARGSETTPRVHSRAGSSVSPVSDPPLPIAEDDDDFIIVADLQSHPPRARSPVAPGSGAVCVADRSSSSSCSSRHQRVPCPGLISEFSGLPAGPIYIVWSIPGCSLGNIAGVHCGATSWSGIASTIPGGHYRAGQDRLQALPNSRDCDEDPSARLQRAAQLFQKEASKHKVSSSVTVWLWSSHPRAWVSGV